jgi:outer membrane receptor protein involved in Fe transport
MVVTVGGSADFYQQGSVDKNQLNPKLGLTWSLLPDLTLRAAVFRVLKRTLTTKQTLEPTQVSGFNQFFDDAAGAEAWRYGVALDRKFSSSLFGGVEYSRRDLDVPYFFVPTPPAPPVAELRQADWKERLGRAYLYWTPHPYLALSAEYLYERFDRVREFSFGVEQVTTHRFPFGIGFFHPSGFFARLKATYFDQEGRFVPQLAAAGIPGSDQFWVVDASIGYRLPKRLGFVKLEARNLLDESFKYQDMDTASPVIQPGRLVYLKLTLAI